MPNSIILSPLLCIHNKLSQLKFTMRPAHPLNQFIFDHFLALKRSALLAHRERLAHVYQRLLNSIAKYPLPLICLEQCMALQGVGAKLGNMMDRLIYNQYKKYRLDYQPAQQEGQITQSEFSQQATSQPQFKKQKSSKRKYSPQVGSGAWQILTAVQDDHRKGVKSVSKSVIKQKLKDKLGKSNLGSMKSLVKHGYLHQESSDQYSVTMQGKVHLNSNKQQSISTSQIKLEPPKVKSRSFQAGEYQLILIIDNRQVKSHKDRNYISETLANNYGLTVQLKNLAVGDFLWVVQHSELYYAVGYILERKRTDDLASSIIDGRYRQQKGRLKDSGLPGLFYLIEGSYSGCILSEDKLRNAIRSTRVDGFNVLLSSNISETCQQIALLTKAIKQKIQIGFQAVTFQDFQKFNNKNFIRLNQQFALMLQEIQGVGKETASALASHFTGIHEFWRQLKSRSEEQRYALVSQAGKSSKKLQFSTVGRIIKTICGQD